MRWVGAIALVSCGAMAQPVNPCSVYPYRLLPQCASSQYPTAPTFPPSAPAALFYFAPSGGFGMGSGPCRGQVMVDVGQHVVTYTRSAGVSGDGGVAVATCVRESDGLGVELADGEPMVMQSPTYSNTMGVVTENAGTNFLNSTWDLASAAWTATATVTADVWSGPFTHYRTASGFERVNDTSGATSQSVCQTYTTSTQTTYAFSCTLRAGTLTTARLSIAGTGNSAGDRTCAISGLDTTLSRDDRKGCVTTSAYGAGLSAVTVCVLPGANAGDTGTIGAVDCQLEKNDHITSYIPNGWPANTSTRLVSAASVPTAPATLTLSETKGCAGSDLYAFKYDNETFWSIITASRSGARAPFYYPDTTGKGYDGTNAPAQARSSIYNSTASASVGWAADGGLSVNVFDAGVTTAAYDGTMFGASISANSLLIESTVGSQDGIVSHVTFDDEDYKCITHATMSNVTRVGWIGDSLSARADITTKAPQGFFLREGVNGTNMAVIGAKFATAANNCELQWSVSGNGTYNTVVVWCGVNDILAGTAGATLQATEQAWIEEWAYRGIAVYWLNISPFKGYDSTASKLTERNNFNSAWSTYCASPATNVHCIDVATSLKSGTDADAMATGYTTDGLHLSQPGASLVSSLVAAGYP